MNVLHVNKHYAPHVGGIETVAQQLAETLGGEVLCCQERGGRKVEQHNGITVTRAASLGRLLSVPLSLDFFIQFRRMVHTADVVVYHHPFPLATIAHLLFARRKQVVIWYHSDIVRQKLLGTLFAPFLRWSMSRAVAVIVASKGLCTHSTFLQQEKRKTTVIPFAVSDPGAVASSDIATIQKRVGNRPIILAVGRLVYYKGFQVLPAVLRAVPEAVCLVIGTGPLQESLRAAAERVGVADRYFHISPVADLRPYFAAATVFAFPSNAPSEAFGIVQAEALAAGLPVVNMQVPSGVPEVSVDGVTGFTVPVDDGAAFAAAVARVVRDPELRARFSAAAVARARAEYSVEVFQKRVIQLFATIHS